MHASSSLPWAIGKVSGGDLTQVPTCEIDSKNNIKPESEDVDHSPSIDDQTEADNA